MLSNAKIEYLASATLRNRAEQRKFEVEALEVERRSNPRWRVGVIALKFGPGGIVAAGLFAAWIVSFFHPIMTAEQQLAKIELRKIEVQNEIQRLENVLLTQNLEKKNEGLTQRMATLAQTAQTLESRLQTESRKYGELSLKHELTEFDRARYSDLAASSRAETASLQRQLSDLQVTHEGTPVPTSDRSIDRWEDYQQAARSTAVFGAFPLSQRTYSTIPTRTPVDQSLSDLKLTIYNRGISDEAADIRETARLHGATVDVLNGYLSMPSNSNLEPGVLYYRHEKDRDRVQKLAEFVGTRAYLGFRNPIRAVQQTDAVANPTLCVGCLLLIPDTSLARMAQREDESIAGVALHSESRLQEIGGLFFQHVTEPRLDLVDWQSIDSWTVARKESR